MPEWTREYPTTPGFYWFYGWNYGKTTPDDQPDLHVVKVVQAGGENNPHRLYIMDGALTWQSDGHIGMFTPMTLPALPELE